MFQQFLGVQQQSLFADALVDDVAQALAARFRSQGAAGAPQIGHAFDDLVVDGAHAQRRQGKTDLFAGATVQHAVAKCLEGGKISGAQGKKGYFVKTGFMQAVVQQAGNICQGTLAHGPVDHARMAEPAAARTATGDF